MSYVVTGISAAPDGELVEDTHTYDTLAKAKINYHWKIGLNDRVDLTWTNEVDDDELLHRWTKDPAS